MDQPKVSCTCITHNRVSLLKKSIDCFEKQNYGNKELIILFENDPATEGYILSNPDFGFGELIDIKSTSPSVFIEVAEGGNLGPVSGLNLRIRNKGGMYLNATNGQWEYMMEPSSDFEVTMDDVVNHKFRIKHKDNWINFSPDGSVLFTPDPGLAKEYGYSRLLNTSISLDILPNDHPQESADRIGWQKNIFRKGKNGSIQFYKIITSEKLTLGMKRNLSIKVAEGEYICVWDDDDWYSENRISNQMNFLSFTGKAACTLAYTVLFDHNTEKAYYNLERATGHENTLLFRKKGAGQYGNVNVEEDTPMLLSFYNYNQLSVMEDPELYIYNYHQKNTCSPSHFQMVIGRSNLLSEEYAKKIKRTLTEMTHRV